MVLNPSNLVYAANLGEIFENMNRTIDNWSGPFLTVLGVLLLGYAAWKTFRYITGNPQQQQQTNIFLVILAAILGALFTGSGGWNMWKNLGNQGRDTINDLIEGNGAAVLTNPEVKIEK